MALALACVALACGDDGTPAEPSSATDVGSSTTRPSPSTDPATADASTVADPTTTSSSGPPPSDTTAELTASSTTTTITTTDDDASTGLPERCEAPAVVTPCDALTDDPTPLQAIGLGCPLPPDQAIPLAWSTFQSPDPAAWRIATQLGSHVDDTGTPTWGPTHGDQLLLISSGSIAPPDALGRVTMTTLDQDANANPDDKPLPAPMVSTPGSGGVPFAGCDGVGDCSDSLETQWLAGGSAAHDLLWFQLRTQVPGGTHGFALDVAFFSEEFPESVGTTFNDMLVVWSNSEAYVGNLCFRGAQPCAITTLWPVAYEGFTPELHDTGFAEQGFHTGGGTGWFQITGLAEPHELLELTFALFDMGDDMLDTLVLLDGFAWDCQGAEP